MNKRKWLRGVVIAGVAFVAASAIGSRALRASAARRYLIAHLAASFGRPVDVSWFDFRLLDGARIEAHYVSVAEDPHFGNEYFLRSDTLTAGVRWSALLAGRFEFGSVSLSRASLNLARDADGHWNIERWLPPAASPGARPGFVGPMPVSHEVRATRPARIDIDGGRINFKQGDNKSPFALVDVSGRVEQNGAGRWQLDLEARPMRAGVGLQDIGMLRLRGSIAGTTARLQPAEINLTWRAASVADALRLVRENDYGMRGQLDVDVTARIAPEEAVPIRNVDRGAALWSISGVARFTGMHGWRLPAHETDPAANLSLDLDWRLGEPRARIRKIAAEMRESHIEGSGELDWTRGVQPEFHFQSSTLALGDVLSWYRAMRPDVAPDLRVDCSLGLELKLAGWPIQIEQGTIASVGGTLTGKSLAGPLRIGALKASISRGQADLAPVAVSFPTAPTETARENEEQEGGPQNSFVVSGSIGSPSNGLFQRTPDWNLAIEGATPRLQDWLALSSAIAQPLHLGGTAAGGLAVKIRGAHRAGAPAVPWLGAMDFTGLTLSPAYINRSLRLSKAHIEFAPLQRTIALSSAEAFGAEWHGSLFRKYSDKQWTFDLSADRLDAAELDRWLGPRARPGFLARLTGSTSAAPAVPDTDAIVTHLAARGRLRAGAIDVSSMHIEHFDGDAELDGRTIRVRKAQGDFFGGKISGALEAHLSQAPSYDFQGRFDRVDLEQLGGAVAFLDGRIGGIASASLTLSAQGIGRQDLIASMEGQGTVSGRNTSLRGLDPSAIFPGDNPESASDAFAAIQGAFRIRDRAIELGDFELDNSRGRLEAQGRIDFSHALNLRFHPSIYQAATSLASVSPPDFLLGGTVEAPKLVISPSGLKPVRPNAR